MLIELDVDWGNKTKVIDTQKIISISGVEERMIGDTSNKRHGWDYYTIQYIDNSELEIRGLKGDLEKQRIALIEYWNKDKKEIVKI